MIFVQEIFSCPTPNRKPSNIETFVVEICSPNRRPEPAARQHAHIAGGRHQAAEGVACAGWLLP